jgi:hypothetical protein
MNAGASQHVINCTYTTPNPWILHRRHAIANGSHAVPAAVAVPAHGRLLEAVGPEGLRERPDVEHEVFGVLHDDAVDAPVEQEDPHRDAAEVPDAPALDVAGDRPPVREAVPAVDLELAVPVEVHLERAVRRPVLVPRHAHRQDAPREPEALQHLVRARLSGEVAGGADERGRRRAEGGGGGEQDEERDDARQAHHHGGSWSRLLETRIIRDFVGEVMGLESETRRISLDSREIGRSCQMGDHIGFGLA